MCSVCGCGPGQVSVDGETYHHAHDHDHDHTHDHHHHDHGHHHSHAHGTSPSRMVEIEQDILTKNDAFAAKNRAVFASSGQLVLNLVSSPGSGKTTLLCKTIEELKSSLPVSVIEGDQQTQNDADRIRATGVPAIQVNTGKGCHLDAHMVGHALERLSLEDAGVLFIENVGNLVCPAGFNLGEAHKVVVLSVTEGEDKPLKYPDMFAASDVMLLNKVDLLPHLDFDADLAIENARKVNPAIKVFPVSARTGEGFDIWLSFIRAASTLASLGTATSPTAHAQAAE